MKPPVKLSPIESSLRQIRATLREGTDLVAVSKFHPASAIQDAYEAGQRVFGESRVQELQEKYQTLKDSCPDIRWHFIGPLQTNKVKYIAPYIDLIESITSERLLLEVNRQALRFERQISVLLEIHIAREETKSGFTRQELVELLQKCQSTPSQYSGVRIRGLMAMASFTDDEEQIRREFTEVRELQQQLVHQGLVSSEDFSILSMGMSGDYLIAQECGSTSVRIGSAIFGQREY